MLVFGYRAEMFRTNFAENICLSSGGEERFKGVEPAYTIIHVVEEQNIFTIVFQGYVWELWQLYPIIGEESTREGISRSNLLSMSVKLTMLKAL